VQHRRIVNAGRRGLCAAVLLVAARAVEAGSPDYLTLDEPQLGLEATLEQAEAAGTNGALVTFIARYPDDPLADRARALLAARRQPDPAPYPGPDGTIIAAFDRARLAGPAALADFARTYPNHPLAAEAARPFWTE
jgi:hypothetical protein